MERKQRKRGARRTKKTIVKRKKPAPKPAKRKKPAPKPAKRKKPAPKRKKPAPKPVKRKKPAPKPVKRKKPAPKRKKPAPKRKKPAPKPVKRKKPVAAKPTQRDPRLWRATERIARDALRFIVDGAFDVRVLKKGKIAIVRVPLVDYPMRAKSALANGWEPERLAERLEQLPQFAFTGKRRVLVRALAFLIDDEDDTAYDPQWITLIPKYAPTDGQSVRMAFYNALEWLRRYIESLHQYTASKLVRFTMLEVAYWPMGPRSPTNGHSASKKRGKTR